MIAESQNKDPNLRRLAAQRHLYSKAKLFCWLRLSLSVPLVVLISIVVTALKSSTLFTLAGIQPQDYSWALAAYSLFAFIVNFVLEGIQRNGTGRAAVIQEEFDCDVLDIPWNYTLVRKRAKAESIIEYAEPYLKKHGPQELRDWYSCPTDPVPIEVLRIICQRQNVFYDTRLRRNYSLLVLISSCIGFIIVFVAGLLQDLTMRMFLQWILYPILPIAGFAVTELLRNQRSMTNLEEIATCIDEQWKVALADDQNKEARNASRLLQDRIYLHRKDGVLIPDWLYKRLRPSTERLLTATSEEMTSEYLSACTPSLRKK